MQVNMKKNQIDMTTGSIIKKQIWFIIPLILTGQLQLLYNAIDVIVVGKFAGTTALSAVGSTSALINLLINVFMGLSVGSSVITALYFGSKDEENIHKTVHTAFSVAIIGGVFLLFLGILTTPTILRWMDTPEDVIDQAIMYLRIIFIGMPFNLIYNFGAGMLRAIGDTKRPLIFLSISGIVNVVLNLLFVVVFHMDVAGVAWATIIAQFVSVCFIIHCFMTNEGALKLYIRKIRIHKEQCLKMIKIGLPAGIQGSFFSLSNVLIQSSINGFGSVAMAGNTASANLEGFIFTAMNSVHQSAVTFAGQNVGAKEYKRVYKNLYCSFAMVVCIGVGMGAIFALFDNQLIGLYTNDPAAIEVGILRLRMFCGCYFLCGIMDVMTGHLRGTGHSMVPMLVTLVGVCAFRVFWIFCVFASWETLESLYFSYPISWILTFIALFIYYQFSVKKKMCREE